MSLCACECGLLRPFPLVGCVRSTGRAAAAAGGAHGGARGAGARLATMVARGARVNYVTQSMRQ
jgi:hypothetical protein